VQFDGSNHYKIEEVVINNSRKYLSVGKWVQQRNAYIPAYYFTVTPRVLSDFEIMNHYQQTSPRSHFTQNLICSIPTEHGRVSLINNRLIFSTGAVRKEMRVVNEDIYQKLEEHFAISTHLVKQVPAMKYAAMLAE
jgi:N-hydroxyarylamine O-acetyltransferase